MYFEAESKKFLALLNVLQNKKVAVIGHVRPDGDCIGSQIALCRVLRSRGIDAVCVNQHKVPFYLQDFVEDSPFFSLENFQNDGREIIAVDCGDRLRLGAELLEKYFAGTSISAVIDHHQSNSNFAPCSIVVPAAAATCFLLAAMLIDCEIEFDLCTARALYAGIVTDTGCFQYSSTTCAVFAVAGTLVCKGVKPDLISHRIYEQEKFAKIDLLQRYLATAELRGNGKLAFGYIPKNAYELTGTSHEDAEAFVNYLRNLAGVKIACQLEQSSVGIKGSLRANDDDSRVDLLAAELAKTFGGNGGGHIRAAGFSLPNLDLDNDREAVFAVIQSWLQKR